MTLPANIRINVRAPFPAIVAGAAFIQVSKANGVWTINPNYALLSPSISLTPTQIVALFDTATGIWTYATATQLIAAATGSYRTVTAAGTVTIIATDTTILLNKSPSGASTIQLPNSATRNGVPLTVKDLTGDANTNNITFVPAIGETIDGMSASAAAANGTAVISIDYGKKTLYPLSSGGWYVA